MSNIFKKCSNSKSLPDINKWNISNVADLSGKFSDCLKLEFLPDISKWNTSNVTNMNEMFIIVKN